MIAKVRLTHMVDIFVKGDSEEQIMDWARQATPSGAEIETVRAEKIIDEDYGEEILCFVRDDSDYDIDLREVII